MDETTALLPKPRQRLIVLWSLAMGMVVVGSGSLVVASSSLLLATKPPGKVYVVHNDRLYYSYPLRPEWGNFPLSCDLFDDDAYYPLKPGGDPSNPSEDCEAQDAYEPRCLECLENTACRTVCGGAAPLCTGQSGFEYIEPCRWQAIADTPQLCSHGFEAIPPLASRNAAPQVAREDIEPDVSIQAELHDNMSTWQINATVPLYWSCSFHSMCQACADPHERFGLNPYCLAAIVHYDRAGSGGITRDVFDDLDFWCSADGQEHVFNAPLLLD